MNTVILISVLCTLGVVAVVTAIVVAFTRMKKRVEEINSNTNREFERVYQYIKEKNNTLEGQISRVDEDSNREFTAILERVRSGETYSKENIVKDFRECYSFIDSRCDKLDSKISGKNCKRKPNEKQLLTD